MRPIIQLPNKLPLHLFDSFNLQKKERILVFISFLYIRHFRYKIDEEIFIQIPSKSLKERLGSTDYKKTIDFLLESEICLSDYTWAKNNKAIGYRLTDEILSSPHQIAYSLKSKSVISLYQKLRDKEKHLQRQTIKNAGFPYEQICFKNLPSLSWNPKAIEVIEGEEDSKKLPHLQMAYRSIENQEFWFTVDHKTGRLYSVVSNMSRNLRPYLLADGKPLVEIDIKSCQPLLLTSFYNSFRSDHLKEKESFIFFMKNEDFYLYFGEKIGVLDRNKAKKRVLTDLLFSFYHPSWQKMMPHFERKFPILGTILKEKRSKKDFNKVAIEMQSKEAEIVLKKAVTKLSETNVFVLSIHDSLMTFPEFESVVSQTLKDCFHEVMGFHPQISIKRPFEAIAP